MKVEIKREKIPHAIYDTVGIVGVLRFQSGVDTKIIINQDIDEIKIPDEEIIKHRIQVAIWSEFYGDILKDLVELEFEILAKHPVNWAFKEKLDKLVERIKKVID